MAHPKKNRPRPPFPEQHLTKPGIESEMNPRPIYINEDYQPAGKLKDAVAIITGGDSGIGRAVAVIFAREGANVCICHLPEEESDALETKRIIAEQGRRAIAMAGDITQYNFCQSVVDNTVRHFGKLDILVNNAAYQQHVNNLEDLSLEQWDHTFKTNIYSYFYMVKAALAYLPEGAVIINTGSITGLEGSPELIDYSSTKGAIHAFTKALARKLVERGIRVNCVAPGPVWTPLNPAERDPKEVVEFGASVAYGRPAQPDEIAPTYVFLASAADSSYMTGEVITLLGGKTRAA